MPRHIVIPVGRATAWRSRLAEARPAAEGETPLDVMVILHRQAKLLEIVDALRTAGRLASGLNRRQQ